MSVELVIQDPLGERALAAADFPLGVGGTGSTVALAGLPPAPAAWIALHDGQLFLQPVEGGAALRLNGAAVARSSWLRDGDVVDAGTGRLRVLLRGDERRLVVEDGSRGDLTQPPEPAAGPTVSGGGDGEEERIEAVAFRTPASTPPPRRASYRSIAGAVAAVLLAFVLWFLWAGRSVEIVTQPAAESARLEGAFPALRTGARHFVRPGRYVFVAGRPGYEVLRQPVVVTEASGQSLQFALVRRPGRLRVESSVAAQVSIDGRPVGAAPGEFRLREGKHVVAVVAPRHLPFQADVAIAGGDRLQVLKASLVPAWAPLEVLTEPSGAEVRVGGEVRGVTPLKVKLGAGSHRVELRHPGYQPWISDVQIEANRPQTLGPVRLGLPDGRLVVRSQPAGASLSVGGAYRGRTPLEIDVRPETPLPVLLARDGYESATASVTLAPGERRVLELKLPAVLGEVTVQGTPSGAEVLAGGQVVGRLGQTFRLPSATQPIDVRATGYRTRRIEITPRPGLPQVIEVRLDPERGTSVATTTTTPAPGSAAEPQVSPPQGPLQASIRTRGGLELKLLPAGSYTMGSARRESGRRANEAQRPVELQRRFYLATREVTNAEYRQFDPAHRSGFVGQNTLERDRQPVVAVSWQQAAAYCNWLSRQEGLPAAYESRGGRLVPVQPMNTGYRLPTEAEWEWAARANRDGSLRKYPWGDSLPVPPGAGNLGDRMAQPLLQAVIEGYDDGYAVTAPVASFAPNVLGLHDLGGNVAEWTSDLYTVQPSGGAAAVDPLATGDGRLWVIRGSGWRHATVTELRAAFRDYGEGGRDDVGLRIARYAE